jgi:hypothetical protein
VDGVREYESPAHAPRFPYRLGTHGTVWGFGLKERVYLGIFRKCKVFWFVLVCYETVLFVSVVSI